MRFGFPLAVLLLLAVACDSPRERVNGPTDSGIRRVEVSSSFIRSIGYDESSRVLEVEMLAGSVYRYFDVPVDVYSAFLSASSKGTFLNKHVKPRFRFKRIV